MPSALRCVCIAQPFIRRGNHATPDLHINRARMHGRLQFCGFGCSAFGTDTNVRGAQSRNASGVDYHLNGGQRLHAGLRAYG
jgi:hypothetical protein